MIFLEKFFLPTESRREYPYRLLYTKMPDVISFSPITIFYGSNGSGKSTLLNVIAEKIAVQHKTKGNNSLFYKDYVKKCAFETATKNEKPLKIPPDSRFIRSEDIMEGIVNLRNETAEAVNNIMRLQGMTEIDGEDGTEFNLFDEKEMRSAVQRYNETPEQFSNGETAMLFFENTFQPDTSYLLDEPENSLSPRFQLTLKQMIEKCAYLLNCQFIIATHSPFLLSAENATIYDLDHYYSGACKWYELENVRTYYDFFKVNGRLFEK